MTPAPTPFDSAPQMRQVTIEIPLAVAQKMAETFEGTLEDATLAGLKLIHGMGMPAYTKLQALAKHFETSVPKTLRTAITALAADAEKVAPTPAKIGRPKINEERDTAVYVQVTHGATYAETANIFGLSLVRVGQIMAEQRALRGVPSRRPRATSVAPTVWPATQTEVQDAEAYVHRTEKAPLVAGLHAMEKPEQLEEVLRLKDSEDVPAKPRYVMPGLQPRSTAAPDTRTAKERDVIDPEFGF